MLKVGKVSFTELQTYPLQGFNKSSASYWLKMYIGDKAAWARVRILYVV